MDFVVHWAHIIRIDFQDHRGTTLLHYRYFYSVEQFSGLFPEPERWILSCSRRLAILDNDIAVYSLVSKIRRVGSECSPAYRHFEHWLSFYPENLSCTFQKT